MQTRQLGNSNARSFGEQLRCAEGNGLSCMGMSFS